MRSMYAANGHDIYLVGHCDDTRGALWHYDGRGWKAVPLIDELLCVGSLYNIAGTSSKDIWIFGADCGYSGQPKR